MKKRLWYAILALLASLSMWFEPIVARARKVGHSNLDKFIRRGGSGARMMARYMLRQRGWPAIAGGATNFPDGVLSRGVPLDGPGIPVTGGSVFHLSSTHAATSDNNTGEDPDFPFTTLDALIAKCTADKGDVILAYPGHVESIANAQIDLDVAGVSVIGLGRGTLRPRIDYDHANAIFDI